MSLIQIGVIRRTPEGIGRTLATLEATSAIAHDSEIISILMTMTAVVLTLRGGTMMTMRMRMIMRMIRGAASRDRVVRDDHRSGRCRRYVGSGGSLRRDDGRNGSGRLTEYVIIPRGRSDVVV